MKIFTPISWLLGCLVSLRRWLYQKGIFSVWYAPVPVCIVGNITVGGTGKTPLVVWLTEWLTRRGVRVGVVSRGYGGKASHYPLLVSANSLCRDVGDENVLIYKRTKIPVVVDPLRVRATQFLLEHHAVDVVIADDGLQHYKLGRAIEIAVLDGARGVGNGLLLPFGPLREPQKRLNEVEWIAVKGAPALGKFDTFVSDVELSPIEFENLGTGAVLSPDKFRLEFSDSVCALAAIGNPQSFQNTLSQIGIKVRVQSFRDHHYFRVKDFVDTHGTIIVTEKDAQKICELAMELDHIWYLKVKVNLSKSVDRHLSTLFAGQGITLAELN